MRNESRFYRGRLKRKLYKAALEDPRQLRLGLGKDVSAREPPDEKAKSG